MEGEKGAECSHSATRPQRDNPRAQLLLLREGGEEKRGREEGERGGSALPSPDRASRGLRRGEAGSSPRVRSRGRGVYAGGLCMSMCVCACMCVYKQDHLILLHPRYLEDARKNQEEISQIFLGEEVGVCLCVCVQASHCSSGRGSGSAQL